MATPAQSQRPPANTSSGTSGPPVQSSRWGRSGEPGSAFNGLARGGGRGRGNGRGRGGRGGRGAGGNRDGRPIGDASDKTDTNAAKNAPTPPAAPKPAPLPTPSAEKASTPSVSSPRPRGPSRRASKPAPVVTVAQASASTDTPPTPSSARPQNRRRRSQSGKAVGNTLPKINVPSRDDNLLRPNRTRLGPVPHSAPIKDTPPHLSNSFDMRNNIDALVERVRAVAMADNRPSTPGSHIDWAGDDDDSLPDLDDWGVTPMTGVGDKTSMISPIIVDGLRSLPDPNVGSLSPSPSEKDELVPSPAVEDSKGEKPMISSKSDVSSPDDRSLIHPERGELQIQQAPQSSIAPSSDSAHVAVPQVMLHPSLPPKPAEISTVIPGFRRGSTATPMRNPSPPKQPVTTTSTSNVVVEPPEKGESVEREPKKAPITQETTQPFHAPIQEPPKDELFLDYKPREGLTASIHAPQALLESVSAPSSLATFSPPPEPRNHNLTHTRAHTVGRPFQDFNGRPSRSGHSTPRGGPSTGGHHARTHSSPPAGVVLNGHRSHARPVITGDAISRLARTIGNTTVSPARVAAAHD